MRIALISDVHANAFALDAVLADLSAGSSQGLRAEPFDHIVCLGDMIQGGAQPAQVAARLRELDCPVVMGNSDAWLLTGVATGRERVTDEQRAVRAWSLAQLTEADREFIAGFAPTIQIELDETQRLLCFHGSPTSFDDIILPDTPEAEFQKYLGAYQSFILAGGHTHLQQIRRIGDSFFFNPGSAGTAYSHQQTEENFHLDPWAEYAVLSSENQSSSAAGGRVALEFRRVPFDVDELVRIYRASGRPFAEKRIAEYRR
jgi:predicted phosphodiesterase